MIVPVPTVHYRQLQLELAHLHDSEKHEPNRIHDKYPYLSLVRRRGRRIREIESQLEKEFMAAFSFGLDRYGLARRIKQEPLFDFSYSNDFDHCTFYRSGELLTVVSQPYWCHYSLFGTSDELNHHCSKPVNELLATTNISPSAKVSVIPACEWSFYYPGSASLVILSFPRDYKKITMRVVRA